MVVFPRYNMFEIYFYPISLFTQFILLFEQLINKYQRWDPHENPRSETAREGRGALPVGRVAFRCRGFNASSYLFVGPVLSGSHVSGFGWKQLLCCEFLYESERPPHPFAFLPTSPNMSLRLSSHFTSSICLHCALALFLSSTRTSPSSRR